MTARPSPPKAAGVAFPWPRVDEVRCRAVRLAAHDPVWIAAIRQQVDRWRSSRATNLSLVACESVWQFAHGTVNVVEVGRANLESVCDWLAANRKEFRPLLALLCRSTLASPVDRAAATAMLIESGANCVLATPREAGELSQCIDHYWESQEASPADPLDNLPLPCWGPAWQWPSGRLGLST